MGQYLVGLLFNANKAWVRQIIEGIIAATDSRTRHLLQACTIAGVKVPDEVAIVSIDDEDLANYLSRISLTTVVQGARQLGFQAAGLLHARLSSRDQNALRRIVVPPVGIKARMSTDVKGHRIRCWGCTVVSQREHP
ncbi:substrate-binding domain-containing protein [Rahnella sp. PCH160]|uniref:substrate-binding domain-containing protein n=1 Tax=Rahnella sp. PCH160 TaxID=3447928 RepID=UPI0039FBF8BB